jgi:hypothetical protein
MTGTIIHCYLSEARIYENLNDPSNAEHSRVEALNFQLEFCGYADSLIRGDSSYPASSMVTELKIAPDDVQEPGRWTPLHRRLKTAGDTAGGILQQAVIPGWVKKIKDKGKDPERPKPMNMPEHLDKQRKTLDERISELEKQVILTTFELCHVQTTGLDLVFFGGKEGLFSVDGLTGELVNCFNTDSTVVSQPIVSGNTVLFGCHDGKLYAVDIETWKERWQLQTGVSTWNGFAVTDGFVYVNLDDNCLCSVAVDTGEERWRFDVRGRIQSAPVISDGTVYFGTTSGRILALDVITGSQKWSYDKKDFRSGQIAVWRRI